MANTLSEKLYKWSLEELNLVTDGGASKIPDREIFSKLAKGKNKKVFNYVVNHVRSQSAVRNIKRTLYIKKILKEREEGLTCSNVSPEELETLQSAVARAAEKRKYLTNKVSTIQDRLLTLEEDVQGTKEEISRRNQKTSFLDLSNQQLTEKNSSVANTCCEIYAHKNKLVPCDSLRESNKLSATEPYDFRNDIIVENCDENVSGIRSFLNLIALYKNSSKDCPNIFMNAGKSRMQLSDSVVLLKRNCDTDLRYFSATNFENLSSEEFRIDHNKQDSAKVLLARLSSKNVFNSLSASKNKKKVEELLIAKEKVFEDKIAGAKLEPNDGDFNLVHALVQKRAENEALVVCNNFMDNYIKELSHETDIILGDLHKRKICSDEFTFIPQMFFDSSDLTCYLMYSAGSTFQKVLKDFTSLQSFVHKDMFNFHLPADECLEKLKKSLISDRIISLNYCDKALIKPLYLKSCLLTQDFLTCLKLKAFQNISSLCENWISRKQNLRVEAYSNKFAEVPSVNVSEMYSNFVTLLDKMKSSVDECFSITQEGAKLCDKTKFEVQEWWEQNAQFIPHIEHEGKSLKMWIDILGLLSDFESQNGLQK